MHQIEKLALKYFLVLLAARILIYFMAIHLPAILLQISPDIYFAYEEVYHPISAHVWNLAVAIILYFDCRKYIRNRILIPVLTFFMPIIGVSLFFIEFFTIQKLVTNE